MSVGILGVLAVLVIIPILWRVGSGSSSLSSLQLASRDEFEYRVHPFWYVFVALGGAVGFVWYAVPVLSPHPGLVGWVFFCAVGSMFVFAGIASFFRFVRAYLYVGADVIRLKYKGPEKVVRLGQVKNAYSGAGGNTVVETCTGERVVIPGFFRGRNEFLALIAYRSKQTARESSCEH